MPPVSNSPPPGRAGRESAASTGPPARFCFPRVRATSPRPVARGRAGILCLVPWLLLALAAAQDEAAGADAPLTLEVQAVHDSLSFTSGWWGESDPHYWISTAGEPHDLLRFEGLDVPQGATITGARLTVWSFNAAADDDDDYVTVWMEQTDDAEQASDPADAWARKEAGGLTVRWATTNPGRDRPQPSPDLSDLVQEIVERPGWSAGNAVQFFARSTSDPAHDGRQMHSYYTGAAGATRPTLEVEYAAAEDDATEAGATVISELTSEERYATFVRALQETGLLSSLAGAGPITVFAPTEEAFAALDEEELRSLFDDDEELTRFVRFHVLRDDVIVGRGGQRVTNGAVNPLDQVLTVPEASGGER